MPKIDAIGGGHFDAVRDNHGGEPGGDFGQQGNEQQQKKKKKKSKKKGASSPSQNDQLERGHRPTPGHAAQLSGLPTGAGAEPGMETQIAGMRARLTELESTFQYIGTGHPDFAKMKVEVDQLRAIIGAYEAED